MIPHCSSRSESVWKLVDMLFGRLSPLRAQARVILLVLVKKLSHPSSAIVLEFARKTEYIHIHIWCRGEGGSKK